MMQRRGFIAAGGAFVAGCLACEAQGQTYPDVPRDLDPMAMESGDPLFTDGDLAKNAIGKAFGLISDLHQPFQATYDTADGSRKFSDLTGKIRLLALWAEWCPPCVKELAELAALQSKYAGDRFEILAILTGSSTGMDYKTARQFVDNAGAAALPLWIEPSGGHKTLALAVPLSTPMIPLPPGRPSIPCMVLVDDKAVVRGHLIGLQSAPAAPGAPSSGSDAPGDATLGSVTTSRPMTPEDAQKPSVWSTPEADAFITALLAGGLA